MGKVSEVYSELFHFTDLEGIAGILTSQNLRATHFQNLNDSSEIVAFGAPLKRIIQPYFVHSLQKIAREVQPELWNVILRHGGLQKAALKEAESLVDVMYKVTLEGRYFGELFVTSFCGFRSDNTTYSKLIEKNGVLSQWRGYGVEKDRYAMVFDTEELELQLTQEGQAHNYSALHLSDVVYGEDEDRLREEFKDELEIITEKVSTLFFGGWEDEEHFTELFDPFVRCISRYKHWGFFEEKEVRLVAMPEYANELYAPLRPKTVIDNGEKKYIELLDLPDTKLPIKRVIVGPNSNTEKLKALLLKLNLDIECLVSDIPFVK